jgi:hypothetical protein
MMLMDLSVITAESVATILPTVARELLIEHGMPRIKAKVVAKDVDVVVKAVATLLVVVVAEVLEKVAKVAKAKAVAKVLAKVAAKVTLVMLIIMDMEMLTSGRKTAPSRLSLRVRASNVVRKATEQMTVAMLHYQS